MDHVYEDDRTKMIWNSKTKTLQVTHKQARCSKVTKYKNQSEGEFYELVSMLEESPSEEAGLSTILDKWEH